MQVDIHDIHVLPSDAQGGQCRHSCAQKRQQQHRIRRGGGGERMGTIRQPRHSGIHLTVRHIEPSLDTILD